MMAALAVLLGGLMLAWPAALNGYPLVFIDTVSYLLHTTQPEIPWDKTQAYGPFLHALHWQRSLWGAVVAQGLFASHLVWLAQRAVRGGTGGAVHLLLCAGLAGLTSAPWFLATLMPDALTALLPLALYLLAFAPLSTRETLWVGAVAALASAAHLSHLVVALALLPLILALARRLRPTLSAGLPVALALLFLCGTTLASFGRFTPSPHGAAFLLARLQADGPAAATLRARCPAAGWHLCGFAHRLPMDSDAFLWDAASPLNIDADGTPRAMGAMQGAAEASRIVAATLADHPGWVAATALRNMARQLVLVQVGDTLENAHLAASARRAIAAHFPPAELAAFDAGAQMQGRLPGAAAPFLALHRPVLIASLLAAPWLLWRALRAGDERRVAVLVLALGALLANAAATGALSAPHDRYQARVAWLLPLAVALAALPRLRQTAGRNRSSTTLPSATV